jgi:hypothetical protein
MSEPRNDGVVDSGESFGIGNEFTGVMVRKVWTKQGERLELSVPKKGYRIMLDAMQLEIVAAQDPGRFTELFAVKLTADDPPAAGHSAEQPDGSEGE